VLDTAVNERRREAVLSREAAFHDALAAELDATGLPTTSMDDLERALFEALGDIDGRDVLDLGCGQGDLTLNLLARGARVAALDVSPGMVALGERRVGLLVPGAAASFVVGDAQATPFADASFDLIVGKWILHHLDVEATCREVRRILRPGGVAIFIENQGANPLLSFARRHLVGRFGIPMYGTSDEHPLVDADFAVAERLFASADRLHPDFFFFALFDRQVLRQRFAAVTRLARGADRASAARIPALRRWSYHVLLRLEVGAREPAG
jgi:SAM-dependent methyltransferase